MDATNEILGYARVSTGQDLGLQLNALHAGLRLKRVFKDVGSGAHGRNSTLAWSASAVATR